MANNENNVSTKHWLTTLMLCWFLGFLGVHRLYAGKIGTGLLMAYWTIVAAVVTYLNVFLGLACFVGVAAAVIRNVITPSRLMNSRRAEIPYPYIGQVTSEGDFENNINIVNALNNRQIQI